MTFHEILNAHTGYTDRELNRWRRARWQAAVFANVVAKSIGGSKKTIKPTDLLKLPDEDGGASEDELETLRERRKWRTGQ